MKKLYSIFLLGIMFMCINIILKGNNEADFNYTLTNLTDNKIVNDKLSNNIVKKTISIKNKTINKPLKLNSIETFIINNLGGIKTRYYEEFGEFFDATYIESTTKVYVLGDNVYATYIDFDSTNGFMLISNDFELYEFEIIGHLSYMENKDFVYYSSKSGFLDLKDNQFIILDKMRKTKTDIVDTKLSSSTSDGEIKDIDTYVKENYPKYTFHSEYRIENYEHICQKDTSIYINNSNGIKYEGNCNLNSVYSILNSWKNQGICNSFPSSSDVMIYDPEIYEPYHEIYLANGWYVNDEIVHSLTSTKKNGLLAINNVPILYAKIRQICYEKNYGYQLDGLIYSYIPSLIKYTSYEYSFYPEIANIGDDFELMETYFTLNGAAQSICVFNSSTYNNHGMACIGYKKYSYKTGWWIFSSTKYVYFLEVDDGHNDDVYDLNGSIWYDPNGSSSSKEIMYVYDKL